MKTLIALLLASSFVVAQGIPSIGSVRTVSAPLTITRVQTSTSSSMNCNPTCSVTIPATGAGHLLVLQYRTGYGSLAYMSSVTGGGSWVTGCRAVNSAYGTIADLAYALSSTSGATSLSVTLSHYDPGAVFVSVEYSGGTFTADGSCVAAADQSALTNPLTAAITTTGSAELVVSIIDQQGLNYGSGTVSAVSGTGWSTPVVANNGSDDVVDARGASGAGVVPGTYQASVAGGLGSPYPYSSVALAFRVN